MPNLARFATLARNAGVVARVAPITSTGATTPQTIKHEHNQQVIGFVAPVAPVAPQNDAAAYWRDLFEERAAIIEYDGGLLRIDAERLAIECVAREQDRLGQTIQCALTREFT